MLRGYAMSDYDKNATLFSAKALEQGVLMHSEDQ
jgi:hypothetical protein